MASCTAGDIGAGTFVGVELIVASKSVEIWTQRSLGSQEKGGQTRSGWQLVGGGMFKSIAECFNSVQVLETSLNPFFGQTANFTTKGCLCSATDSTISVFRILALQLSVVSRFLFRLLDAEGASLDVVAKSETDQDATFGTVFQDSESNNGLE